MFDILTESYVYEYFLYETLFKKWIDKQKILEILRKIFCLPKQNDLYSSIESDIVKEVCTENDYHRFVRIKQYNALLGQEQNFTDQEAALVSIKGDAITTLTKYGISTNSDASPSQVIKALMMEEERGNIIAKRIIGVLQCEGCIVNRNLSSGLNHLEKAAQWADIPSILATLRYCEEKDKQKVVKMFVSAIKNTPYALLDKVIQNKYKVYIQEESKEIDLVKRARSVNALKQDFYNPLYAKIIYSKIINENDKKKIVFSENKELISEVCNLPLQLEFSKIAVRKDAVMDKGICKREKEYNQVIKALQNNDLRHLDAYKPLCLCSESEYLQHTYLSILSKVLNEAHIEKIEVADLYERDFDPTKNNIFIRNMHKHKNTIFLLIMKGDISSGVIKSCKQFLNSAVRRKYILNHPSVTINLSSVLPICICDMENASKLKECVETIELDSIKEDEKPYIIGQIFDEKRKMYMIKDAILSNEAVIFLSSLKIDEADEVMDKFLKDNRNEEGPLVLEEKNIKNYWNKKACVKHKYGFGGDINEYSE